MFLILCALVLVFAGCDNHHHAAYTVGGHVEDIDTHADIANCEVEIRKSDPYFREVVTTDHDGYYDFYNVPDGYYKLTFDAEDRGYYIFETNLNVEYDVDYDVELKRR